MENEVIINELSIQIKNLGLIDECINDVKNALVDILKVYKEEQKNIDEAYQRGLEEGKKATWGLAADASSAEYQRGLDDAWEAARKIELDDGIDMGTLCTIFGYGCSDSIIREYSASEAIAKLKAYEEKQKAADEIKVGDIVYLSGDKYIVSYINDDGCADLIHIWSGSTCERVSPDCLTRTGKRYDIEKILEAMKE